MISNANGTSFCLTSLSCAELLEHPVAVNVKFPMTTYHHLQQHPVYLDLQVHLVLREIRALLVLPVLLDVLALLVLLA